MKKICENKDNQNITLVVKKYTRYNFYHGGFPVYHSKRKASIMYDVSWCLLELLYIRQADCLQIQVKLTVYVYQTVNFYVKMWSRCMGKCVIYLLEILIEHTADM